MQQIVINLIVVNALVTFAQTSSDNGIKEHSRHRRGLEELSRNRRTLLPILRKLREMKSRGISSILGFKKQKKGRFLNFKKNIFPQFPFGIPAKPPTGGHPIPPVNFHHQQRPRHPKHKPHNENQRPPHEVQKPQHQEHKPHHQEQKPPHKKHNSHNHKHKPGVIVDSYGSPIAQAITEVDSYGSPLGPVESFYEAPPVDIPNSYYAPAPTYTKSTPEPTYVETYVKETPASPPPYQSEESPQQQHSYNEPEPLKSYSEPESVKTYTEAEPVKSYTEPQLVKTYTEPEPVKTYFEPEQLKTYTETEQVKTYTEPKPVTTYTEHEPVKTHQEPEPIKTSTEQEPLEIYTKPIEEVYETVDPYNTIAVAPPYEPPTVHQEQYNNPAPADSYGTPIGQPYSSSPPEDSYGTPVSHVITSYVKEPEIPLAPPYSPPAVDSYGTPVSQPLTTYVLEPEPEEYGSLHDPVVTYFVPSSDLLPVSAPDYVSHGFPVSEPNSYGIPLSEPLTSYEPIIQEDPVLNSPDNSLPSPSDTIPEIDLVPFSPNSPELQNIANLVTNLPSSFEDSFNAPVDQVSSNFDTKPGLTNSIFPGEPIITSSTFDQQFEDRQTESNDLLHEIIITTEESNDLSPDIFITTESSKPEQYNDDTENTPAAEPASEHPVGGEPIEVNIADLVSLKDTDRYLFGFTEPQNDDAGSPQGNFPGDQETSEISVANIDTSTEMTTSTQTSSSTSQPSNTEQNVTSSNETGSAQVENTEDDKTNDLLPEIMITTEESNDLLPEIMITTEESNDLLPDIFLPDNESISDKYNPKSVEGAKIPYFIPSKNETKIASITKDDIVTVNKRTYESDILPDFREPASPSLVNEKPAKNALNKSEKRKIVRKKLKGSNNKNIVSTNPQRTHTNNRGNDDNSDEVDILREEADKTTITKEKLILPRNQKLPPFNSLSALFPYYNVDLDSIQNEDLMPVLIEDIFLTQDYEGEGDYDLLPFYDLDNYDLNFEDNFLVYDATSEGQTAPSFYL